MKWKKVKLEKYQLFKILNYLNHYSALVAENLQSNFNELSPENKHVIENIIFDLESIKIELEKKIK